jgi:hypothetical protein
LKAVTKKEPCENSNGTRGQNFNYDFVLAIVVKTRRIIFANMLKFQIQQKQEFQKHYR